MKTLDRTMTKKKLYFETNNALLVFCQISTFMIYYKRGVTND